MCGSGFVRAQYQLRIELVLLREPAAGLVDRAEQRALGHVVDASKQPGTPVAVCGEMAGDPGGALLLLGLGFKRLSVSAAAPPRVKWVIRSVAFSRMESLARQALTLEKPEAIHRLLEHALKDAGLDRLQGVVSENGKIVRQAST